MPDRPPEPWNSFLRDVDEFVSEEIHLHLLGGFVVTVIYGAPRETSDLDVLTTVRLDPKLLEYAGQGSELHRKHGVYLDPVGVAPLPENYEDRLIPVFLQESQALHSGSLRYSPYQDRAEYRARSRRCETSGQGGTFRPEGSGTKI